VEKLSENRCFEGVQGIYSHTSKTCACDMTFGLYLPPQAAVQKVPVLWYLSGLTCTHENAMIKAGAQAYAALHGMAIVFPDTSPRGEGVADDEAYAEFPLDMDRQAITGHSMGGHGALTLAITKPDQYKSVSAFSPICNPSGSDWGRKQFGAYLGEDETLWAERAQPATLRFQAGYDHSYFFVSSFIPDHLSFHADNLGL